MSIASEQQRCPKCGGPIPPEAPQGLCPKCLLAEVSIPTEAGQMSKAVPPSRDELAAAFPHLEILELIGQGGMGFVFKARQPKLDRFVALKILSQSLAADPAFAERFTREGRVLARLSHPNIVAIHDFGQASGFFYLLMEFVDGVNLRQAMRAGRFTPDQALAIVPKICEALQYAHNESILHRDIKPENILIDIKGRVKIADFGIAKLVGEVQPEAHLTGSGATLGTPHYMAPEQIEKPGAVDHRADIYSLGVVFYEMLTGELPLGRFAPPSQKSAADPRVDEVVMRTLEKEREKRFQSAGEMKTTVEHLTDASAADRTQVVTADDDFILCNPRLPRMAKAITVYALIITPIQGLLNLLTIENVPTDNAYAASVQTMTNAVSVIGTILVAVLLFIGGLKLRKLKSTASRLINIALWMSVILTPIVWAGFLLTQSFVANTDDGESTTLWGNVLYDLFNIAAFAFDIAILIWLRRNRALLETIVQAAANRPEPSETMVRNSSTSVPVVPAWSLKAIWGAGLVGVSLTLGLLASVALAKVSYRPEVNLAFALFFLAGAAGIVGTILGWMALSDIRAREGRVRGLLLAVFAGMAWPLLVLLVITGVVAVGTLYMVAVPSPSMVLLLIPAGAFTFTIWSVYAAARWGANQPTTQRHGVLKWIFLALVICGLGAVFALSGSRPFIYSLFNEKDASPEILDRSKPLRSVPDKMDFVASVSMIPNAAPLPEGMIELAAISRHPSDGVWWRPDGSPLNEEPFETGTVSTETIPGERAVEFVFRTRGLEPDNPLHNYFFEGSSRLSGGGTASQDGPNARDGMVVAATFPASFRQTIVRAGVAIDPWETVASATNIGVGSFSFVRHGQPAQVKFLGANGWNPTDPKGRIMLTVAHNLKGEDVRVVMVDGAGREHANTNGTSMSTAESLSTSFESWPHEDVREFRFQARPIRWVEFKNVKLEPNNGLASAENWSPKLALGEKPDLQQILTDAQKLAAEGQHEKALQHHIWYHNHALEYGPGQTGVRLSFALSYWMDLARHYPKAKQALIEVRDRGAREFAQGGGHFDLFMEVSRINEQLSQQDATYALFKSIQSRDPKLARQCYRVAEDLLVEKGDYVLCASFIPNVQDRFEQIRMVRERTLAVADRTPEVDQTPLRKMTEQTFNRDTRKLIEILVGVGRNAEAEKIREQAVAVLNVPELQSAVTDADQKVARNSATLAETELATAIIPTTNMMRSLATRICEGDDAAFGELRLIATELYRNINYTKEQDRVRSNLFLMRAAFQELGEQAGRSNAQAMAALQSAAFNRRLKAHVSDALGIAAAAGNEQALAMLLHHDDWNMLLASAVFALRAPAEQNNEQAIDFLVAVLDKEGNRPLWHGASEGLKVAAANGNAKAKAALEKYEQTKPK